MKILARDIMTRNVATVSPDATVREAATLLAKRGISAMPVCDPHGAMLGIVSEGDLLKPFTAARRIDRDWWLSLLAEGETLADEFLDYVGADNHRVGDLMTREVVSVGPGTSASDIADMLIVHRIKRVPVVERGEILGIVSRADLVRSIGSRKHELAGAA